jgi:uncharacterized membrane protein YozB (DUF420 family)
MEDKTTRLKGQRNTVTIVLSISALILLVISFFIRNGETRNLVRIMAYAFILSTIIFRLFKDEFGYKSTREEFEEKMFGRDKPKIEK